MRGLCSNSRMESTGSGIGYSQASFALRISARYSVSGISRCVVKSWDNIKKVSEPRFPPKRPSSTSRVLKACSRKMNIGKRMMRSSEYPLEL